jgi:hypothetical protein
LCHQMPASFLQRFTIATQLAEGFLQSYSASVSFMESIKEIYGTRRA